MEIDDEIVEVSLKNLEDISESRLLTGGPQQGSSKNSSRQGTPPPRTIRDKSYYFSDGSCVLQAEGVLFNVHRSLLLKEDSSLSTMFALPQGTGSKAEGFSDWSPIILQDSADELRNFLWLLYTNPEGIEMMGGSDADIPKLLSIIRFSHKYCYAGIERWAVSKLEKYITMKAPRIQSRIIRGCTTDTEKFEVVAEMVRVADLSGSADALKRCTAWICELMLLKDALLLSALALADEIESDALIGPVYFELLAKGPQYWATYNLTDRQQLRILRGHYHLVKEWETVWTDVILPNFEGTPDGRYIPTMQAFWDSQMTNPEMKKYHIYDIRGCLGLVQQRLMYVIFDPLSQPEKAAYDSLHKVLRLYNLSYPDKYTDFFTRE